MDFLHIPVNSHEQPQASSRTTLIFSSRASHNFLPASQHSSSSPALPNLVTINILLAHVELWNSQLPRVTQAPSISSIWLHTYIPQCWSDDAKNPNQCSLVHPSCHAGITYPSRFRYRSWATSLIRWMLSTIRWMLSKYVGCYPYTLDALYHMLDDHVNCVIPYIDK